MSILPGFGCPDKVGDVFSPMDRKGTCEAGLGEVSYEHLHGLCNKDVYQWIKELQRLDSRPELSILEIVNRPPKATFDEFKRAIGDRERYWINEYLRLGAPLFNRDGVTRNYRIAIRSEGDWVREDAQPVVELPSQENQRVKTISNMADLSSMRLEDFRIEVAKLTRQQLSVLSDVSVSTIQRAEEGKSINRLMRARILDGLSKHLGREVTRQEIDEFK